MYTNGTIKNVTTPRMLKIPKFALLYLAAKLIIYLSRTDISHQCMRRPPNWQFYDNLRFKPNNLAPLPEILGTSHDAMETLLISFLNLQPSKMQ